MSSLAAQLAQSASLNVALLADRSKRKPIESYLFTGKEASQHDLDSIYALGVNAFLKLCSVDQRLRRFEHELFSDRARGLDRTLLGKEEDERLGEVIGQFLALLGPWVLDTPAANVMEWLVRRFRVNEFDLENLLVPFLPYHDTVQFAKLVTILHIKPSSTWSFLLPFKSAAQHVPRVSLVTEMLRNTDVARFVTSMLPSALKENRSHRVLLAFNAATLHEFISRSKNLNEGTLAYLLPALLEPLEKRDEILRDAVLGSFILLSALSQKCELSASALKAVVGSMATRASVVATRHFMSAAVAVCEPQTELDTLPGSTTKAILKLSDMQEKLETTANWAGSEKLLRPFVTSLVSRLSDNRAAELLESLISTPATPPSVIEHIANLLVKEVLSNENAERANVARPLLSSLHQRYPDAFQRATKIEQDEDEDLRHATDQLILSFSMVSTMSGGSKDIGDMILASTSAETNVRLIAVRELLSALSDSSLAPKDKVSITSALISRIQDPEQEILEIIYEKSALITPPFASEATMYIQNLSASLDLKPRRSILRLHFLFLLGRLYPNLDSEVKEQVISEVVFPFLLFSKPRQHTAETVWDLIAETIGKETGKEFEMLKGCADVVKVERERPSDDVVEKLRSINAALSEKIAQNFLMSDPLFELLPVLLSKIESSVPYTRALGYLIARALLEKLSGQHQVDVAGKILQAMKLEEIGGLQDLPAEHDKVLETLKNAPEKHIVLKPTKQTTLSWLQVSLIASISAISAPDGLDLNWLSHQESARDDGGSKYIALMRKVYSVINRSSALPVLISCLLGIFFDNLGADALAFLAGIWTSETSPASDVNHASLQEIALRHAAAFLEAHVLEDDRVDFQTMIPALLVALQNHTIGVRKAAVECLNRIRLISERKLKCVYKFDIIYGGDIKDTLQYLDQDDLKRYLAYLVAHQQHFTHDHAYLRVAHAEHLKPVQGDRKKDAQYKNNVLCCLLSHVNALDVESTKVKLLESLSLVSSNAKAISLLPSIETLQTGQCNSRLATLLVSSIDASSATQLNDIEEGLWEVYLQVLRLYLRPSSDHEPRDVLIRLLETELFEKLGHERQTAVVEMIINIAARDTDAQTYSKKLLSSVLKEVPLMVDLLNTLAPVAQDNTPRAAKRVKINEPDGNDDTLPGLTLLAEILGSKNLPGSLDLVSVLLETLNKLIQSSLEPQADVNYAEQMLMSAVENAAHNIQETPNITPNVIRLDVLVEVIRVVRNPQTFHQALLLMASLARLAPESVLHNVMPVFTFMGSNVFHRDDTYSFRVVQKTIDGIVPVMASSLKGAHADSLDLYIASRDFLRVFTDAANHIPRHRRNKFFIHLVEVLGIEHFLAPICMLLTEKSTNRVVKQNQEGAASALSLPITLMQHASPSIQITALFEVLKESQRLASGASTPTDHPPLLLGHVVDGEATVTTNTYLKRAQALATLIDQCILPYTFVGLDEPGKETMGSLVSGLIALGTIDDRLAGAKSNGLVDAAQKALDKVLAAMPSLDFIEAILFILGSNNVVTYTGALELLSQRIPKISDNVRQEAVTTIKNIVGRIIKLLAQDSLLLRTHCLKALAAIASTLVPKEETVMTAAVSPTLGALKIPELVLNALDVIIPLSTKLGPRLIPFFNDIVSASVELLKNADDILLEKTTAVLQGLLISIPAFWGPDALTRIVKLYMDHCKSNSGHPRAAMASLIRSITKKVPAKVLLPVLMDIWPTAASSRNLDHITAYSEILSRTLHHTPRTSVLEHVRSLSNVFLEALDAVKVSESRGNKAEKTVISAFKQLVVKLNDSTFRLVFRRLYDWAFVEEMADNARKNIFFLTFCDLLDFFKALMVPYTSFLLPAFNTYLKSTAESSDDSFSLWLSLVTTLTKTLLYDGGGFWRDDKLRQIATPLIQQVPRCTNFPIDSEAKKALQQSLDALVEDVSDDALLKSINLDLLMHTRSDNAQVRQYALVCSESLWRAHGGKLVGFASETATFIAECGEDDNDIVVKESFRLKEAVESVAGKIDGL